MYRFTNLHAYKYNRESVRMLTRIIGNQLIELRVDETARAQNQILRDLLPDQIVNRMTHRLMKRNQTVSSASSSPMFRANSSGTKISDVRISQQSAEGASPADSEAAPASVPIVVPTSTLSDRTNIERGDRKANGHSALGPQRKRTTSGSAHSGPASFTAPASYEVLHAVDNAISIHTTASWSNLRQRTCSSPPPKQPTIAP